MLARQPQSGWDHTDAEVRRFDVGDYYRMAETGILHPDERIELIDGEIVRMSPMGSRHAGCVHRLNNFFARVLGEAVIVACQCPLRLSDFSEPEPDIALLRPRADFYSTSHPAPADVLLLVEVADTSSGFDREIKLPLYAAAGIEEVWIVDLAAGNVRAARRPHERSFRQLQVYEPGESLSPVAFPRAVLQVADLVP